MEIEEESAERIHFLKSSGASGLSIGSLEASEMVVSELNPSVVRLGLDILEEQGGKRFFCQAWEGLNIAH